MSLDYKKKKIWLNGKKTKYCDVMLFRSQKKMQDYYRSVCPKDKHHSTVRGVSTCWEMYGADADGSFIKPLILSPKTGEVLLCMKYSGAGIVCHELMHAVIWARKHKIMKKQYPVVIRSMNEEEELLHDLTRALQQFYSWYWKVEKDLK